MIIAEPRRTPLCRSSSMPATRNSKATISRITSPALVNIATSSGRFLLVAQGAAQDLADVGLGQVGAELDVFRPLVAGELLPAMLQDVLLGQIRVLLHHEHFRHFAGML